MASDLLDSAVRELEDLFEPLSLAAGEPEHLFALLRRLGWTIDDLLQSLDALASGLGGVRDVVTEIRAIADGGPVDLARIGSALSRTAGIPPAVRLLEQKIATLVPAAAADLVGLASELLEQLFTDWLIRRHPLVFATLAATGLVVQELTVEKRDADNRVLRRAVPVERVRLGALGAWFTNPAAQATAMFGFATMTDEASARAYAARLFPVLGLLAAATGALPALGRGGPLQRMSDEDELDLAHMLALEWSSALADGSFSTLGVNIATVSATEGGPGLALMPFGDVTLEVAGSGWIGTAEIGGELPLLLVKSDAVDFGDGGAGDWSAAMHLKRAAGTRIGGPTGTLFEIGAVSLGAELQLGKTRRDIAIEFDAIESRLVVAAGDEDGFLAKMLPAKGVDFKFDLGFAWSLSSGLRFKGAASGDAEWPLKGSFGGVLFLDTLSAHIGARTEKDVSRFEAWLGLSLAVTLGPVKANIDRVGLRLDLSKPPGGGSAGPLDARIAFKPPSGIGIVVDASIVKGGGFLRIEPEIAQYSGVLQLAIQKTIDVKAIGILNARLPGGKPGFSLLLIITAEFPPIQLGMGFTLNGIGGLAGINRTAAVDVLRAGLRNGALDTMLFPRDPLANVPALLSTLGAVFPVAEGRYVFGPMVRIGWGSPAILTLDVAVLIELPDPVRIILLGRLKAALPDEKKPVAVIRMDALGVLDFGRKELSLDATIYDSRILTFTLSGDMALRLSWGANPGFLLSVGGFHPHFQPPVGMPTLARMALVLVDFEKDGVTARVRLDSYFAITSNTVQFGAHVQAYVKVLAVEVQGLLGFDALVHFPFAIDAQMVAAVTLSFNGALLMGAEVALNLTGPGPWHLVGEARFVFLGVQARAHIDFTSASASAATAELPPPADVAAQLVAALKDARNWQPVLAEALPRVARLAPAEVGAGELLMHPLAGLAVRQRVAPLGVLLARYGNAPIAGGLSRFQLQLNLANAATAPLREAFAMGQYQVLSDSDKLARPSFEEADAGLQVQVSDFGFAADAVLVVPAAAFEDRLVDPASAPPTAPPMAAPRRRARALRLPKLPKVQAQAVQAYLDARAAAELAPRTRSGKGRYAPVPPTTPF